MSWVSAVSGLKAVINASFKELNTNFKRSIKVKHKNSRDWEQLAGVTTVLEPPCFFHLTVLSVSITRTSEWKKRV